MSVLYPIKVNGFKLYVNPTKMEVQKRSQIQETRTMAGTTFQVWPDLPDEVRFEGMTFGMRSIWELRGLAKAIERNPESKQVTLTYKSNEYVGYIKDLSVSADSENPRQYFYRFTFIVKHPRFQVDTMPEGQTPGLRTELDFFTSQTRQASSELASMPADLANDASAVYGQIFGTSGRAQSGLNMFIGRPRSSNVTFRRLTGGR